MSAGMGVYIGARLLVTLRDPYNTWCEVFRYGFRLSRKPVWILTWFLTSSRTYVFDLAILLARVLLKSKWYFVAV